MALSHPKLELHIEPMLVDPNTIFQIVREWHKRLQYVGKWYHDDQVYVFVQNKERLSSLKVTELLDGYGYVVIKKISKYSNVKGELLQESGARPVRGNGGGGV
ncbi:unnamed protein product [Hapterophycus canaliculatus]